MLAPPSDAELLEEFALVNILYNFSVKTDIAINMLKPWWDRQLVMVTRDIKYLYVLIVFGVIKTQGF